MTSKKELYVVYINITLYAICYMAQVPVLPYLTKKLGADSATYGVLQTFFSTLQFFGGLLAGPLVDRYGGKALLQISFLSSVISYSLTAMSSSMTLLYVSRIPTLLQHAVLAARTIVTLLTTEEERARYLGYVGMAYGVGFAVGPALGGMISQISLDLAAWVAASGSLLSLVLVTALLPGTSSKVQPSNPSKNDDDPSRTLPEAQKGSLATNSAPKPASSPAPKPAKPARTTGQRLGELLEVCRVEGMGHLLLTKVVAGMALALFQSMFSPMLQNQFGLSSRGNGLVLSYLGVVTIAVQVGLVGWVTKSFDDVTITEMCVAGMTSGFLGLALSHRVELVLVAMLPLCASGLLLSTVNTAQMTKAVPMSQSGSMIAVDMAVGSGVRMLSPTVGGFLAASSWGYPAVSWVSATLTLLLLALLRGRVVDVSRAEAARKAKAE